MNNGSRYTGSISDLQQQLAAQHYVADRGLALGLLDRLHYQTFLAAAVVPPTVAAFS